MVAPTRPANPYAGPRASGRPGTRPVSARDIYRRPMLVSILAVLNFISAPFMLLAAAGLFLVGTTQQELPAGLVLGFGGFYAIFGLLALFCGIGLWGLKSYGRTLQLVQSFIGLIGFPIGTLISTLILVYFFKPGVKVLFSEQPISRLSAADIQEVRKVHESSSGLVVIVVVVVLLAVVAGIGVIAAIAIPSLLRARVAANEAQAIGDIRTVISAETAYTSSNGGQYDTLECLSAPAECLPGYPVDGVSFLSVPMTGDRSGYRREFVTGAPSDASDVAFANLSRTSMQSFAIIAYPIEPGVSGTRSFCGDYTGLICVFSDGARPPTEGGQCPASCTPLQ